MHRRNFLLGAALLAGTGTSFAAERVGKFDSVLSRWDRDEHPDLKGVVVMRAGRIVTERYFNGETATNLHDIRSAGKSITSLLMGAAIDRRHIRNVMDPVERYLPESKGSALEGVKLQDLLTMRSGLAAFDEQADSPGHEDRLDEASDPVAFALSVPRLDAPGKTYRYNSLTAYITGLVIERAVQQPLKAFAQAALFDPLGIKHWEWVSDVAGHTKGQGNLSLTARDFATIGQMVFDKGMHGGTRVLSEAWLRESLDPRVDISASDPYADGYGYFWYHKTHEVSGRKVDVSFASGNGGNKIYVIPSRDLVIAITSSAYGKGYGQRRSQAILLALLEADLTS